MPLRALAWPGGAVAASVAPRRAATPNEATSASPARAGRGRVVRLDRVDQHNAYQRLRDLVDDDRRVVGFFLGGSRGKGVETDRSDYDCYVIVEDSEVDAWRVVAEELSPPLDIALFSLTAFAAGEGPEWNRYNYAHLDVEVDRLGGRIQQLVDARATITSEEGAVAARAALDAYINAAYRSLKNLRDGLELEAILDASEAVNYGLTVLFGLLGRLRPYNKYLRWELTHHPPSGLPWQTEELVTLVSGILRNSDPALQSKFFRGIEQLAHARGLTDVIEAWPPADLRFLRRDD